jgi:hypothetical protein
LVGYFEGIHSERGIAWRANDSLGLRRFLRLELEESPPGDSPISRIQRLIDLETHREVFRRVLRMVAERGVAEGADDRHRRHDAGGQRGAALGLCAARQD